MTTNILARARLRMRCLVLPVLIFVSVFQCTTIARAAGLTLSKITESSITIGLLAAEFSRSDKPNIRLLAKSVVSLTDLTLSAAETLSSIAKIPGLDTATQVFVPAQKLFSLSNNLFDLAVTLKALRVAREGGHVEAQAQATLKATTLALETTTDIVSIGASIGSKLSLVTAVAKAEVVVVELAVDYYGEHRRANASANVKKLMDLQNATINTIRKNIDDYIEARSQYGTINVKDVERFIVGPAQKAINELNQPPLNNLAPKPGLGWAFDNFFSDNVQAKTYLQVYDYLQDIVHEKNPRFSVPGVAQRLDTYVRLNKENAKHLSDNLEGRAAVLSQHLASLRERATPVTPEQEQGPAVEIPPTDDGSLTDEDKANIPQDNQPAPGRFDTKWRGVVSGIIRNGSGTAAQVMWSDGAETTNPSGTTRLEPSNYGQGSQIKGPTTGRYQYTAWGTWNGDWDVTNGPDNVSEGQWIVGQHTILTEAVTNLGTAKYRGSLTGDYESNGGQNVSVGAIYGDVTITADFANMNLNANLTMKKKGSSTN